jgi:hypothetical protein
VSQLVDDALKSAMEIETKISEATKSFDRAINEISGLMGSPTNTPVANRNSVGPVTKEVVRAYTNHMPGTLVADELEEDFYSEVGTYYFCTSYG